MMEESWKSCFEEELLCPICLNVFDEPVQLPCKHNFCQSCISEAWAKESAAGGVRCPECNHEYGQKPSVLEKNIKLANIVERYNSLNTEKPAAALHCVLCRRGPPLPVQKVCLRCKEPCCQSHIQTHLQQPSPAPGHLLVDVEELRAWTCPRHDEYRLLHCHDEHAAVCQFCCISRCAGQRHAVCDVDTQRAEMQHVLMRHQERLDARVQNIDEQLCKLESDKILVKDAVGQLKDRVRSQYQRMHAVLDADLSETVKLLDSVHGAYRHRNSQQALRLKERQQEADRLLSTAQVFCHRAEDINFMKNTKPYQLLLDRSKAYLASSLPPHKVGQLNSHLLLSELTKREQSLRKVLEEPFRDSSVLQVVPVSSQSGSGCVASAPEPEKRKHGVAFAGESNPGSSASSSSQDHLLHGGKRAFLGGDQRGGGGGGGGGSSLLYPPVEALSQTLPHPGGHSSHHVLDSSAQQRLAALGAGVVASSRHSGLGGGSLFPPAPPPHYPPPSNVGAHHSQQSMLPPQYGGRKILVCSLDNCYCSRGPPPPPPPPPHHGGRGPAPYPVSESSFPWVGSQEYPPPPPHHHASLSSGQPGGLVSMREWMEQTPSQSPAPRHPHPDFYRLYGQSPLSIL